MKILYYVFFVIWDFCDLCLVAFILCCENYAYFMSLGWKLKEDRENWELRCSCNFYRLNHVICRLIVVRNCFIKGIQAKGMFQCPSFVDLKYVEVAKLGFPTIYVFFQSFQIFQSCFLAFHLSNILFVCNFCFRCPIRSKQGTKMNRQVNLSLSLMVIKSEWCFVWTNFFSVYWFLLEFLNHIYYCNSIAFSCCAREVYPFLHGQ